MPRECAICWEDARILAMLTGRTREQEYRDLLTQRDQENDNGTLEDDHA